LVKREKSGCPGSNATPYAVEFRLLPAYLYLENKVLKFQMRESLDFAYLLLGLGNNKVVNFERGNPQMIADGNNKVLNCHTGESRYATPICLLSPSRRLGVNVPVTLRVYFKI